MLSGLFPRSADNDYPGPKVALWLFGILIFIRVAMSVNSILNGASVLITADGVPLSTYPRTASQTIVALFALLGLSRLTMSALCAVALIRYRSLVPLLFALLLLEQLVRHLILRLIPIFRTDAPAASIINIVLLALTIAGLALSLWRREGDS